LWFFIVEGAKLPADEPRQYKGVSGWQFFHHLPLGAKSGSRLPPIGEPLNFYPIRESASSLKPRKGWASHLASWGYAGHVWKALEARWGSEKMVPSARARYLYPNSNRRFPKSAKRLDGVVVRRGSSEFRWKTQGWWRTSALLERMRRTEVLPFTEG
jgi:hypothetical protein